MTELERQLTAALRKLSAQYETAQRWYGFGGYIKMRPAPRLFSQNALTHDASIYPIRI